MYKKHTRMEMEMEINRLSTIPLEIQYLIFDSLNPIDTERTIKVIGLDLGDLYWTRHHRKKFVSVVDEINSIEYSIESIIDDDKERDVHNSTRVIGEHTTRHSILEFTPAGQWRGELRDLEICSSKLMKICIDEAFVRNYKTYDWSAENNFKIWRYIYIKRKRRSCSYSCSHDKFFEGKWTRIIISDTYIQRDFIKPPPLE